MTAENIDSDSNKKKAQPSHEIIDTVDAKNGGIHIDQGLAIVSTADGLELALERFANSQTDTIIIGEELLQNTKLSDIWETMAADRQDHLYISTIGKNSAISIHNLDLMKLH